MKNITPIEAFQTERLMLRPLELNDAGQVFLLRSDATVNRYINRAPATTIEDAQSFIRMIENLSAENKTVYRAITLKDADTLIGSVTLWNFDWALNKAEIGYELLPAYQGKGFMQEAVAAMIRLAFNTLGFTVIEAWTHPENQSSGNLLLKLGFVRDHAAEATKPADVKEIIYTLQKDHSYT